MEELLKQIKEGKLSAADAKKVAAAIKDIDGAKEVFANFAKINLESVLPDKIKEANAKLIADLGSATGVKKEDSQELGVYLKSLKEKLKGSAEPNEEIKKLQAENKLLQDSDKLASHLKEQMASLKSDYVTKLEATRKELTDYKAGSLENNKRALVTAQFAGLKKASNVPQGMFDSWKKGKIEQMVKDSDLDETGKIRYKKADGKYYTNDTLENATAAEILQKDATTKEYFATDTAGGGASDQTRTNNDGGTSSGKGINTNSSMTGTKQGDTDSRKLVLDKSKFVTRTEFQQHYAVVAKEQGISVGSQDYFKFEKATAEEYGVKEMPR